MIGLSATMLDTLAAVGNRAVTAAEIGGNGYCLRILTERGLLSADRDGSPFIYETTDAGKAVLKALNAPVKPIDREAPIARIQRHVAHHFKIPPIEMVSQRRTRDVARPRQVAMYLAKQTTPKSLPDIGRRFGGRDHTTVIHAIRRVESLMAENKAFSKEVETLKSALLSTKVVDESHSTAFCDASAGA